MAAAPPVGPVPPAPPAGPLPAPPAAAPQRCYQDFYADDSHDSANGNYAAIMDALAVPALAVPTPQEVADTVLASAVVDPQAFVGLIIDANHPDGRVTLFHRLQHYEPQLGQPTPFDNNAYTFYGDLVGGGRHPQSSNGLETHSIRPRPQCECPPTRPSMRPWRQTLRRSCSIRPHLRTQTRKWCELVALPYSRSDTSDYSYPVH